MYKIISLLIISSSVLAQADVQSMALGDLYLANPAPWSRFRNPTTFNAQKGLLVGVAQFRMPGLSDVSQNQLAFNYATESRNYSLNLEQFGNAYYQDNRLELALGLKLNNAWRLGLGLNNRHCYQAEFGSQFKFLGRLNLSGLLSANWQWHLQYLHNFAAAHLSEARIESRWDLNDKLKLMAGGKIHLMGHSVLAIAWQYRLVNNLYLRQGFSGPELKIDAGLGFKFKHFRADLAIRYQKNLGNLIGLGLSYQKP